MNIYMPASYGSAVDTLADQSAAADLLSACDPVSQAGNGNYKISDLRPLKVGPQICNEIEPAGSVYASSDKEVARLLKSINHDSTKLCAFAERAMLKALDGNCNSPIAGYSWIEGDRLFLRGEVLHPDRRYVNGVVRSSRILDPEDLGASVAEELNARGAQQIIKMSRYWDDSATALSN